MELIKRILIMGALIWLVHPANAGERGYLGASFGNISSKEKSVKTGVIVKKVFPGMAAQQAGLKPGEIVTQINGTSVSDPRIAVDMIAENGAGERISLTVVERARGQLRQSRLFVTLGRMPTSEFAKIMTAKPIEKHARISLKQAADIAFRARPGEITGRTLEYQKGGTGLRYTFSIREKATTYEVGIDARSGAILKNARQGVHQ